ncbi:SRPBCC family protein [uncultured Shewanella sp.]|uniref:SRPBCC family protein n=1 Tax=uncultured Shewanella sp. TaxID=173975 RepID=UPI0026288866|nr:SRPBCC family protein [uncultured Shewanella sp.]
MIITKNIVINKSADHVWKILAHDFDSVYQWMGPVRHSYAISADQPSSDAPVEGRICEFTNKPNGFQASEVITHYNEANKSYTFELTPLNAPKLLPVKKNTVKIAVKAINSSSAEVTWISTPEIKPIAILLSPLLKLGLGKSFGDILKQLKTFSEAP